MKKQVVTISREYGSGGREVAKLLSEEFRFTTEKK